jgi:hypothetical protein
MATLANFTDATGHVIISGDGEDEDGVGYLTTMVFDGTFLTGIFTQTLLRAPEFDHKHSGHFELSERFAATPDLAENGIAWIDHVAYLTGFPDTV